MDLLHLLRLAGAKVTKRKRSASCQEGSGSNSFSTPTPKSKGMEPPNQKRQKSGEKNSAFRWSYFQTKCLLDFLAEKAREGEDRNTNNGFKNQTLVEAAKHVSEQFGTVIESTQVYNHLRGWKTKWMRIQRAKNMSGVNWDDERKMIVMGPEEAKTYLKANFKDEAFINKPIDLYEELSLVCGHDFATGQYAKDNQEPLGTHELAGDEEFGGEFPIDVDSGGEPSKGTGTRSMSVSQSKGKKKASSSKRSRDRNWDALEGMTNAVCKVADALTAKHSVDESRALKLMDSLKPLAVYGFNEDQIDSACEHLLLAPTTAAMFFARSTERRVIWMTNFCAQNCPNN